MTAFASYTNASCLEHFPKIHLTRFSLSQALTCGVMTVIGTNRASSLTVSGVNFECAVANLAEAFAQSMRTRAVAMSSEALPYDLHGTQHGFAQNLACLYSYQYCL